MYKTLIFFLCIPFLLSGQDSFRLPEGKEKLVIPFELISNMILIKAKVNGVEMDFALDTGAPRTSILNLVGVDSLSVNQGNIVKIRGYGKLEPMPALYSQNNQISVNGFNADSSNIYILTDNQISLLPLIGREVNGVIGADFLQNHPIHINYISEKITVYRNMGDVPNSKKRTPIDITFENRKPFLEILLPTTDNSRKVKVLVDTGSGDSLWLYGEDKHIKTSPKSFESYLGLGVSGEVYGKRTKVTSLSLNRFDFEKVTVAFPKAEFLESEIEFNGKNGSIGNEILRRFSVLFNYKQNKIFLSTNKYANEGFYYNMLGISVKEGENDLITSILTLRENSKTQNGSVFVSTLNSRSIIYKYVPKIIVNTVSPGSLADQKGVKSGDEIISLNSKDIGEFSITDINRYIFNKPNKTIYLKFKRGEIIFKKRFFLRPIID